MSYQAELNYAAAVHRAQGEVLKHSETSDEDLQAEAERVQQRVDELGAQYEQASSELEALDTEIARRKKVGRMQTPEDAASSVERLRARLAERSARRRKPTG